MVCQAVKNETIIFMLHSEKELEEELEKYNAPPEAIEAKLEVKKCVDKMVYGDKFFVSINLVCSYLFALSDSHK